MAPSKSHAAGVQSRCASVKRGIEQSEECPKRVKRMLLASLDLTVGTPAADRHPFNERFVAMIDEVLQGEHARLRQEVETKEKSFAELSPAQATREAALEQAKARSAEQAQVLTEAKRAVTDIASTVKAATAEVKAAKKAQKTGDEELDRITAKKVALESCVSESLTPIVDGTIEEEARSEKAKIVVDTGRSYAFDSSLMNTAEGLLAKPSGERGAFDQTCLQQVQDAFAGQIAAFNDQLATGAPAKAERATAVEKAESDKQAAENSQTDLKEKAAAAQEAKHGADAEAKAAAKSLADFMPDLKNSGDALDGAKTNLQSFIDGCQNAFGELKTFKVDDFHIEKKKKEAPAEQADGEASAEVAGAPEASA